MSDEAGKEGIIAALKDVYSEGQVDDYWKSSSDLTPEERLKKFESGPICSASSFCREPNLQVLAEEIIGKEKEREWRILCVGCGKGPEPYELAMRLLQLGQRNFKIDGFDVSKEAIVEAQKGEIVHDNYYGNSETKNFLKKMEAASLIKRGESLVRPKRRWFREEKQRVPPRTINYSLDESVRSRMNFFTHDIIEKPFREQEQYDVVVCNTVLQHYPPWTRELILANILRSLKDGGILALERNESLDLLGIIDARLRIERFAWLKPYYDWKKDLSRFGLTPEEVESEKILMPTTFYRYEADKNQYRGKELAIRDRKLVEIPEK